VVKGVPLVQQPGSLKLLEHRERIRGARTVERQPKAKATRNVPILLDEPPRKQSQGHKLVVGGKKLL
jgi:hypothetical protein